MYNTDMNNTQVNTAKCPKCDDSTLKMTDTFGADGTVVCLDCGTTWVLIVQWDWDGEIGNWELLALKGA
jgi:hypothetical protein